MAPNWTLPRRSRSCRGRRTRRQYDILFRRGQRRHLENFRRRHGMDANFRSAPHRLDWRHRCRSPPIQKPSTREPASPTFAPAFLSATAFTSPMMAARRGRTSALRTRATSAGWSSIRKTQMSFMSEPWVTPTLPTNSAEFISPSMECSHLDESSGSGTRHRHLRSRDLFFQSSTLICWNMRHTHRPPWSTYAPIDTDPAAACSVLKMRAKTLVSPLRPRITRGRLGARWR